MSKKEKKRKEKRLMEDIYWLYCMHAVGYL
jgi:hypothetical protein